MTRIFKNPFGLESNSMLSTSKWQKSKSHQSAWDHITIVTSSPLPLPSSLYIIIIIITITITITITIIIITLFKHHHHHHHHHHSIPATSAKHLTQYAADVVQAATSAPKSVFWSRSLLFGRSGGILSFKFNHSNSFIHSLIHSFTHSLIHSFIHSTHLIVFFFT